MNSNTQKVNALLDALIEIAEDGERETSTEELTEEELQYWYQKYGVDNLNDLKEEYLMDKYGRIAEETPDFSFKELKLKHLTQDEYRARFEDGELETLRPIMDQAEKPTTLNNDNEKDPLPF